MAFEQELSIEIFDAKINKLTCCDDVVRSIVSGNEQKLWRIPNLDFQFNSSSPSSNSFFSHNLSY